MKDSKGKALKEGYLATLAVSIKNIESGAVTLDLGGEHYITLTAEQVKSSLTTEGVKAPEKPVKTTAIISGDVMEISVEDFAGTKDGGK